MVISLFLMLAGMICIGRLPVAEYPEVAPPTIVVVATYTGASATVIAESIAAPLEAEINGIEGLIYYSSTSGNSGNYSLTLTFKSDVDPDIAMVNVNNAVKRAERVLPTEVVMNGIGVFKRTADFLATIAFTSDNPNHTPLFLSNYVSNNVKDTVAMVDGIGQAVIFGELKYSMRVWLNPTKMRAYNISQAEVQAAIRGQNIQAATGSLGTEAASESMQFKVESKGRLRETSEFEDIIIRSGDDGRLIRLSDIARIELGAQNFTGRPTLNDKPATVLAVFKLSDANALDIMNKTKGVIGELSKTFPEGMSWTMAYDSTLFVEAAMMEIAITLLITFVLVIIITYIFLQDWRATLVPMVAIPVSLIGTFLFLYIFGMGINTLTMFGLILAIGSVVDDAICVVECCMRLIHEEKMSPKEAAFRAMEELSGAMIATVLVVVAVYAPIAFFGGMVGTIYRQFAVTMCIALGISGLVALTLSPAMCALILKDEGEPHFWGRWFNNGLAFTRNRYLNVSGVLAKHSILTVVVLAALLYGNYAMYNRLPSSFLPQEDKGSLFCEILLPAGSALPKTQTAIQEFVELIKDIDGVGAIQGIPGRSVTSGEGENMARVIVRLKHWDERKTPETSITSIQQEIQRRGADLVDAKVDVFIPPAINGLGQAGGVSFALQAIGDLDQQELARTANELVDRLNGLDKMVLKASTSFNVDTPMVNLDIDRSKAEAMKVPVNAIFSTLQSQLGSLYVNDFNMYGKTYQVKMQSENEYRDNINAIGRLTVPSETGKLIPMDVLASVGWTLGPKQVERFNMFPAANVRTQGLPFVSSGELMKTVKNIVDTELGDDYKIGWTDLSYQESQNEGQIVWLILLAVLFAYLFLVAQYESWTMPIAVMLSVTTATLGGMVALYFAGIPLDIYCQLGLLMLVGLTAKTAILMVEYCKQMREEGNTVREAALAGMRVRFRAVMMTALSFVIGVMPMVFATGAGAGSRVSIGTTTFWGMVAATIFGMALIPGLFVITCFMSENTKKLVSALFSGRKSGGYSQQRQ